MNQSQIYPIVDFGITDYLKKYFDFFALKDDQEAERQELEDRQREEREAEAARLKEEADSARQEKEDAERREKDANSEAEKL